MGTGEILNGGNPATEKHNIPQRISIDTVNMSALVY